MGRGGGTLVPKHHDYCTFEDDGELCIWFCNACKIIGNIRWTTTQIRKNVRL